MSARQSSAARRGDLLLPEFTSRTLLKKSHISRMLARGVLPRPIEPGVRVAGNFLLPVDLKEWLRIKAHANHRTLNAEVIKRLEDSRAMDEKRAVAP